MFKPLNCLLGLVLLILTVGAAMTVWAQDDNMPLILDDPQTNYPVGLHLAYLEDPGSNLTIDDVIQPEFAEKFIPNHEQNPNFGPTDSTYWIRFHVRNETSQVGDWRLSFPDARMGLIDLYYQQSGEIGWEHQQAGNFRPSTVREYILPHFVFPLSLPASSEGTVYLRMQSNLTMRFLLTLWPAGLFERSEHSLFLIWGGFYGIIFVMAVYNLVVFLFLRKRSYLYYFLFISTLALNAACIDGTAYVYLFPNWTHKYSILATAAISPVFATIFIRDFLELKRRIPWLDRILVILAALSGLALPVYLFHIPALDNLAFLLIANVSVVIGILAIIAALEIWRQGFVIARYFLIAWLGLILNVTLRNLSAQSLLPFFSSYDLMYYVTTIWMVIFLSLALADQINVLRIQAKETEKSLRRSEERFRHLYERSPVGICLADSTGRIMQANRSLQELLGYSERELKNHQFYDLVHPDDRPFVSHSYQQLLQNKVPFYSGEVRYLHIDGNPIWVWRSVSTLRDAEGKINQTYAIVQDIQVRRKQEAALRRYSEHMEELVAERTRALENSREQLAILNRANQTIISAGLDSELVYTAIRATCAWLMPADVVAISLVDQAAGEVEDIFLMDRDRRLPGRQYPLKGSFIEEILHDGRKVIVYDDQASPTWPDSPSGVRSGMAVPLQGSEVILGVLRVQSYTPNAYKEINQSILEAFMSHVTITLENLRHYQRLMRSAVIEERQRLASELHDSVTQLLYSISMMSAGWGLKASKNQLHNPAENFHQIEELSLQALKEMRMLIHQLGSPALVQMGLLQALENRLAKVENRVGIESQLKVEGNLPKLSPVIEEGLYFIILEALNNSLRHARADNVQVNFEAKRKQLHIYVEDDGRGYDTSRLSKGMGATISDDRAKTIGARITRHSEPGKGTRIEIVLGT